MIGFGFGFGFSPLGALLNQTPHHFYVDDSGIPRVASRNTTFAGTTYYVNAAAADDSGNGLTPATAKKTITAAYNAASNGCVIQLADGTYNTASESGGYILLNTGGKGVLIKGNATHPENVVLSLTSSASYVLRLRNCGECKFEDLTISTNQNAPLIYNDFNYNNFCVFKNVGLVNTGTGSSSRIWYSLGRGVAQTNTGHIEFDGCTMSIASSANAFLFDDNGANVQFLFKSCTFSTGTTTPILIPATTIAAKFAVYDSTFNMAGSFTGIQTGNDTAAPTNNLGQIDLRGNTITYADTKYGHAILLGRGVKKVICINNRVTVKNVDNAGAIGIVNKCIADNVGDVMIAGNISTAPRPYVIKGAKKTVSKWNTFIGNLADKNGAVEITNPVNGDGEILNTLNQITDCNLFGQLCSIKTYTSSASEAEQVTMQGWTVDRNNYYTNTGTWGQVDIPITTNIPFASKSLFWNVATSNDNNSKLVGSNAYEISAETKDI